MKKLIALLFCVCVTAVMAQANGLNEQAEQALSAQAKKATRVVQLVVSTGSSPTQTASGKAVIVSAEKDKLVLLTSQALAIDIEVLGDDPVFASVMQNNKKAVRALIAKITADNPGVNQHFYVVTLKGTSFAKVPAIPLQEARKLLK